MRKLVGATAVVAACAVLAGCTTSADPEPQKTPSSPGTSSAAAILGPVTLRFGVYGNQASVAAYTRLADAYTSRHPDVTVQVQVAPDAEAAMANVDTGTAPDVFLVDHEALPALVDAGKVQPVDVLLEQRGVQFGDNYERVGLEAFSANSALQCMPHDVSPLVVYYNKDLLSFRRLVDKKQDVPTPEEGWSWEQFTAAAENMSRGQVKGVYIAPTLESLIPLIRSDGADVVDNDRTPTSLTLSDGNTRSALEQVLAVARDSRLTPTRAELASQDAVTRFEKGTLAMMLGTRALTPELREAGGLRFDVFPLPSFGRFSTLSEMTGYCISADTPHVVAAADFLAFAIGSQGAAITARAGYVVPSNLQVAYSSAFLQPGQQPKNAVVFSDGVGRSNSTPFVASWPEVVRATQPLVDRLFYAPVLDLDTLLLRMDEESRAILSPETASPSPH